MVRSPFDLRDGTAPHAGQKTATHAAVRAIGFCPLLDAFTLDFWHRYTSNATHSDGLTRRCSAPSTDLNRFRHRLPLAVSRANRLNPVDLSVTNSSSAVMLVCASSLRFSISEICRGLARSSRKVIS